MMIRQALIKLHRLLSSQFGFDPRCFLRLVRGIPRFLRDWRRFCEGYSGNLSLMPCLHDRTSKTGFDAHYFYTNGWAMRRIVAQRPAQHADIGSQTMFVNLISAVLPVTFVEYRPLEARMEGLASRSGDILNLPLG